MSNSLYGRQRMDKIVTLVSEGKAFTRPQIQQIFFPFKTGKNKAQERLRHMVDEGQLKRFYSRDSYKPAVYYIDRKPTNLNHVLAINDVYCAFMRQKKDYQIVEWQWEYSVMDKTVVCDAYINFYTQPGKQGRIVIFLEVECDIRKRFNKDIQYKKVWDMDWIKEEWVVVEGNKAIFPIVLIVTNHELKLDPKISKMFKIATPEQVQSDVFSLIKR